VTVDLTDPAVHLVVARTPIAVGAAQAVGEAVAKGDDKAWQSSLQTVRTMAGREHLALAVNGDFFIPRQSVMVGDMKLPYFIGNQARVCGMAMSDGILWSDRAGEPSLLVDKQGRVRIGGVARVPEDALQITSGSHQVVTQGKVTAPNRDRAPRTVVGLDEAAKTMVIMVVDGRRPEYSAGMTLAEAGKEMVHLGCFCALNLDGGGSSTLVMLDGPEAKDGMYKVINRPSDGHDLMIPLSIERPVASVLGIRIDGVAGASAREPEQR